MSKRSYPNYYSDKKRPKLDISITEANFPLSQNFAANRDVATSDNWGDENDDEILLLASQACEQACNENDITSVPDYSICMQQPYSTSTQYANPQPSTSKTDFSFKKPSSNQPSSSTANLRDKCNLISSPLHGITPKVVSRLSEDINMSNNLNFNDRIFNDNSSDIIYKQLLQLQEENTKLKSENGKLHEKCVTKEGEASILRTQLKTCQVAIDNARLEKLKAQEKVQTEWTDKINVLNNQMQDLRTQLDFKNLEIISTKEKCKMLESSKVKLTQVTVSNNDINQSHKSNNSYNNMYPHEPFSRRDKTKMSHSSVQTSRETNFITLHKVPRYEPKALQSYLPLALQPTQNSLRLLSNEKLQTNTEFTQNKCIIYNTYHRIPDNVNRSVTRCKVTIDNVYEDFSQIVSCIECGKEDIVDSYLNILAKTQLTLLDLNNQLEQISNRMTMAFKKDMDERYIELTNQYSVFTEKELINCRSLYKEEQAILPRRLVTMLTLILNNAISSTNLIEHLTKKPINNSDTFIGIINKICLLFNSTYTSIMYSGFLQSIIFLLHSIYKITKEDKLTTELIELFRLIVISRPLPTVVCEVLGIIKYRFDSMKLFCFGSNTGNVKTDFDQGVLLYRKETCPLQVILKVVEATLKCIERDTMYEQAVKVTNDLLLLNSNWKLTRSQDKKCDCQTVLSQVLVYGLQICACMMESCTDSVTLPTLISTCTSGISTLYQLVYRDVDINTRLGHNEGHYQLFVDVCERNRGLVVVNHVYGNMLTELQSTIQSSEDTEMAPNTHHQIWCDSFSQFTITD